MTKLNNEFIAQQKAIEFVKEYPNGDKFSFAQGFEYAMKIASNTEIIGSVVNSLPTKDEVIAEGNKQIEDWLSENHYKEQRAYRVAFRRSYEYVLRFIK